MRKFALAGLGVYGQAQLAAELTAQIKSHSGGFFPVPAVGAGKAFFENSAQFVFGNACAVIQDRKNYPFFFFLCRNCNFSPFLPAVLGAVADKLA